MPGMDGLDLLKEVRDRSDVPFILLTGQGDEEVASELISEGGTDYLRKKTGTHQYDVLVNRIRNAVERSRALDKLRESEQKYRTLVEQSHDAVYISRGRDLLFVNDRVTEITGYERKKLLEMNAFELIHPEDRERVKEIGELRLDGEDVPNEYEARIVTKEGETRYCKFSVHLIKYRGELASMGSVTDITERKERERELEMYGRMLNTVPDMVYALDTEGRIIVANNSASEITGYTADEAMGKHVSLVMDEEDVSRIERIIKDLLEEGGGKSTFEFELVTKNGERIPCEGHMTPLLSEGEFQGTLGVVRDISETKEREKELQRQNEQLEEFVSVVSHDLRNPLSVAKGYVELSLESVNDAESRDYLREVDDALDRMNQLIEDLLTLVRQGKTVGERKDVDVGDIARRAWSNVETNGADLVVECDASVEADESRLMQMFENLFRNSVEHGGAAIRNDGDSTHTVTVRVGCDDESFYVEDTGPGIPKEERDSVLEHGYTTSDGGTGLGLSIVMSIANAHGWDVEVGESPEGGARFDVLLDPDKS